MMSILEQLQRTFRLADAADIALVSLFLYTFFMWFKSSASRPILVGIGVLTIVYLLARAFDLYMTAAIFQAGLAFAAVAAIVVFQEDLRRSFARIASLGKLPRARTDRMDVDLDVLVSIVFELAKKKIGALLAIRGTESVDRHVRGGVATDARISKALLDSIFDPHSMGHDGAVIIDQDRVAQFAARLPLSNNSAQIGSRGTRHSAALGLTEVSDTMVVVVSEERGEVSVAEDGKLERVATPVELKKRLERFTYRVRPRKAADFRRWLLVENSGLKATAVLVACAAWFLVSFEAETVQKTFVVPVEYRNLPDTMDIDDAAPTEARITLTGFERAFNLLAPSTLKVSLDMNKVEEGPQQIVIDESHIKLPSNLALFRSAPRIVEFGVHTWVRARVGVEPRTEGRLPRELRQREIKVIPDTVQVFIWRSYKSS
ncbi:MAG: diadenylate cyclase, partial [Planctomycetes bacterium]|nr:diadenylate cyclase [Planctomycetota bacterium]